MKSIFKTKMILLPAISIVLLCSFGMFGIAAAASSIAAPTGDSDNFIGADGLLYGVPFEGSDGTIVMPDMVRVKADDGGYGYVSPDEMLDVYFGGARNQDEIDDAVAGIRQARIDALMEAADDCFGVEILNYEDAAMISNCLLISGGVEDAEALLAESYSAAMNEIAFADECDADRDMAIPSFDDSPSDFEKSMFDRLFLRARELSSISVSMYSETGFIIGEYDVSVL